ncbi:MAG: GUN4 N-terminal ARM-like repeat domain-containing protein [Cyanobacteria bacterium J06635_10]
MTDPMIQHGTTNSDIDSLRQALIAGSEKNQKVLVEKLATFGTEGLKVLMEFLSKRRDITANIVDGKVYQVLYQSDIAESKEFLQSNFPQGIIPLKSDCNIDYTELQKLLANQDFQEADRLTLQKMCELAGEEAVKRKWLYFTEVEKFPITDLQTINNLWLVHSEGKFGFSVQREMWIGLRKNWENLWIKIGWKNGNNWTRYPNEFIWNLDAPRGHLPLSNQLRGVRAISSLLSHPAWQK